MRKGAFSPICPVLSPPDASTPTPVSSRPRCFRQGYDAEAFSRLGGWTSWGVDLSETAIKEANAFVPLAFPSCPAPRLIVIHPFFACSWYSSLPAPSLTSGPVSYHTLDFFTFPLPSPTAFSVAFDHTFLCALPPTLRSSWAARYADLLPKPGSLLVTMVWPIFADGDERKGTGKGPPWEVDVGVYEGLLLEEQAGKWVKKWEGDGGDIGRLVVWERI